MSKFVSVVYQGLVEPEEFLKAAAQGKMEVVEKFLEDGGDPNTCDEVLCVWNDMFSPVLYQWDIIIVGFFSVFI